jgi:hypothetical protein
VSRKEWNTDEESQVWEPKLEAQLACELDRISPDAPEGSRSLFPDLGRILIRLDRDFDLGLHLRPFLSLHFYF